MGQMVFEPVDSWALGAHATPAQDMAPKGTFAVGENTILLHNTGQSAVIGQREGWTLQNVIPQAGNGAILGQYDFIRATSPLVTSAMHLVVGSTGRFDKLIPAPLRLEAVEAAHPTPFTPGFYPPSFATMNNHCFIANGIDPLKAFNGTYIWTAGLPAPSLPGVTGSAGNCPPGDYSTLVTYYDSVTGLESSASPAQAFYLGGPGTITVSWIPSPSDRPYSHTRVYLRQDAKQTEHFRVAEIPKSTNTAAVSLTQDQLDALTLIAPDFLENNPPPLNLQGIEAHVSRLFGHDGSRVYYSNLDQPEAWDPENSFSVNQDDGQQIIALHAAHEVLVVFKKDSTWALYGEDPATWVPRMISQTTGCLNERSVVYIEGTSYWWSERGPVGWSGSGPIQNLAHGRLDDQVALDVGLSTRAASPNPTLQTTGVVAALDVINQRILWAMPAMGSLQNNLILPFKYSFNQWEATKWTGMDVASFATVQNTLSTPHVYLGGYKGQIFRYGGSFNDGTPGGLLEGKVVSGTATELTVDVTPGPLYTAGAGLSERYLYVNNGDPDGWQVKRIGSNTASMITLATGELFSLVPNAAWTWSVGTIGFRVVLPWQTFATPFIKKRLEYGYFWVGASVNASEMEVALFRNYNNDNRLRHFILDLRSEGMIWDEGQWDQAVWGSGQSTTRARRRLAKVCFAYRWAFRQYKPNADALIYKVDTRAETQVDKP